MSPTMLKTIRSLKDSTFEACAAIGAHLKTEAEAETQIQTKAKAKKHEFKPLVVELRLLGGALYSLESLITELDDTTADSTLGITPSVASSGSDNDLEWPLIDGCGILISALKSFHSYATSDGIKAARSSLLDIRSKIAFVLGSSDSLEDIALQFSILSSDSIPQLMVQKEDDPEAVESPTQTRYDDEHGEPGPEDVSAWLTILNSSDNDREPAEYNRETALVQSRRITEPKYRVAATRWPEYAEKYWQKLRPQVCSLFRIQKSYSFVQWVLEYARETYPRTLGSLALSPRLLLELTDALCDGSISSLHIAAALGLPNLCRDLLSMGADVNQSSILGTPLFCALMGSKVLVTRTEPESWTSLLVGGDSNVDQAATVLLLIEEGADCTYRYHWNNATEEVSLAGLAFWTAMTSKHEAIFTRIVKGGGTLDNAFHHLLQRETLIKRGLLHKTRFARLLTYVYDLTLLDIEREGSDYHELQSLVSQAMRHANVKFAPSTDGKVETLSDKGFIEAIRNSVLDFNVRLVERLTKDPRFDPNLPYDSHRRSGTILHMATEGSQLEIMDILIRAGADVRARDSSGRTPIMVVEDVNSLAKLVLDHSAPTYDTDKGGRTIWHLAAATNDVDLLKFLWEHDPHKARNLEAVCEDGHTPLRAAFSYIKQLEVLPKGSKGIAPSAARFLLDNCQDYIHAEGNEQLARWAIEWGNLPLLQKIFELIPQVNTNDESLLRSLNMSASPGLVSLVLDKCQGLPQQFSNGKTAAETVITNVKLFNNRHGFAKPTAHPSCFPNMMRTAYMQLLTPEVLKSRDSRGRCLWTRFCNDVLPLLNGPSAEHPSNIYFLSAFIRMAISCLVDRGVLAEYEKRKGTWAIMPMTSKGNGSRQPIWERWQFPFIAAVLDSSLCDENRDSRDRSTETGSGQLADTSNAVILLQEAVHLRQPELVELLVLSGINVHKPWVDLAYKSVFQLFLTDWPVDVAMLQPLLSNTKPQEIIVQQHKTFQVVLCIPDNTIAVEVVGRLLERGMDPNNLARTSSVPHQPPPPPILVQAISESKPEIACFLIERGADVGLAQPDGYNALIAAAKTGQVVVLESIIEKAPDDFNWLCVYEKDGDVYNALQLAAAGGHRDFVETLLEATPLFEKINTVTARSGRSPAHLAAKAGSLDCIRILTKFAANFQVKDSSGRTPFFLALLGGNRAVIEYLKEHLPEPDNGQDLSISLQGPPSDSSSDSEMMDAPLDDQAPHGVEVIEQRRLGAMIASAIERHQLSRDSLFKSFLDHASKKDLESAIMPCGGCTLLSYTAAHVLIRPMIELLDLGFKGFVTGCDTHWPDGYNALLNGCLGLQQLMAYNIFISPEKAYSFFEKCLDAYLQEGRLWFHLPVSPIYAICQNQQIIGRPGVEHQSSVLDIFINHLKDHAEEYWTLMEKSGLTGMYEFSGCEDTATKVLRYAVNYRSQIYESDSELKNAARTDPTALHGLVKSSIEVVNCEPFCSMIRMLIKNGADVDAQDGDLSTPLHLAVEFSPLALIEVLLQEGADPNILDDEGLSPLARATAVKKIDVVRCLLKYGADPRTFIGMGFSRVGFADIGDELDVLHEMLGLGLDPYSIALSEASILTTMIHWNPQTRTYALNCSFDFYRLAEQEPFFLSKVVFNGLYWPVELKAILRRIPQEHRAHLVNSEPQADLGPGCLAIREDNVEFLKLFLDAGFDIERDWDNKGSALMYAGSIGAFKSFKMLVRRGARFSYLTTGRRGEAIARSVVEATKVYPKLLQWLLVGRHYETKCLTEGEHSGAFTATKPWSGPRKAAYRFTGIGEQYPWLRSESTIDYLVRMAKLRRSLKGTLPVSLVD
ncbi:hypothetical protein FSARC_11890 [Fusarium sarcochroum]|uniref:Ankyrin n=1 Tax=Fusarium sarcochroum TaxID=1208366 RepID=A0A8H4TCA2_9HYPO|nr:hypothetical protein FSARC_11890 [Fusarium sarcochroum]